MWAIIKSFAQINDAALSVVKNKLKDHLGTCYEFDDWKPAFNAVLQAKDDSDAALAAVNNLKIDTLHKFQLSDAPVDLVEGDLMQAVNELKSRKWIVGTAPTLKDLLNPIQECEIGESPYHFDGGDKEIIAMALAPEIVEVESDLDGSGESKDEDLPLLYKEALDVCEKFGKLCVAHLDAHGVDLLLSQRQARHLQSHLCLLKLASQTQVKLTDMWGPSMNVNS